MAILKPKEGKSVKFTDPAPVGPQIGVCFKVEDRFGATVNKWGGKQGETEIKDITQFFFGLKDKAGKKYVVSTKPYNIYAGSKVKPSALKKMLDGWSSGTLDVSKADYVEWATGRGAMLNIVHVDGNKEGQKFANIDGVSPVMDGLESRVPKASEFAEFLSAPAEASEATGSKAAQANTEGDAPF